MSERESNDLAFPDPAFAVRLMRPAEMDCIRTWATAEGWNPGVHDGPCFFATDPEGFFVGEMDDQPASCISCVAYDDSFGFLGQYIVKPEFRGRGYGIRTWKTGMAHLGLRNVGLDGVLAQCANYERSGFSLAYHHIRYRGQGGGERPPGMVHLSAVPFPDILAYDRDCFPVARPTFLRGWLALPESVGLGCVRHGRLSGYGVLRRSVEGFKVGPLFADDWVVADALLRGLAAAAAGSSFCVDMPEQAANPAVEQLVNRFSLQELFRTARMYTQVPPRLRTERIFGITTLELG
jgi:hypothetical protein